MQLLSEDVDIDGVCVWCEKKASDHTDEEVAVCTRQSDLWHAADDATW